MSSDRSSHVLRSALRPDFSGYEDLDIPPVVPLTLIPPLAQPVPAILPVASERLVAEPKALRLPLHEHRESALGLDLCSDDGKGDSKNRTLRVDDVMAVLQPIQCHIQQLTALCSTSSSERLVRSDDHIDVLSTSLHERFDRQEQALAVQFEYQQRMLEGSLERRLQLLESRFAEKLEQLQETMAVSESELQRVSKSELPCVSESELPWSQGGFKDKRANRKQTLLRCRTSTHEMGLLATPELTQSWKVGRPRFRVSSDTRAVFWAGVEHEQNADAKADASPSSPVGLDSMIDKAATTNWEIQHDSDYLPDMKSMVSQCNLRLTPRQVSSLRVDNPALKQKLLAQVRLLSIQDTIVRLSDPTGHTTGAVAKWTHSIWDMYRVIRNKSLLMSTSEEISFLLLRTETKSPLLDLWKAERHVYLDIQQSRITKRQGSRKLQINTLTKSKLLNLSALMVFVAISPDTVNPEVYYEGAIQLQATILQVLANPCPPEYKGAFVDASTVKALKTLLKVQQSMSIGPSDHELRADLPIHLSWFDVGTPLLILAVNYADSLLSGLREELDDENQIARARIHIHEMMDTVESYFVQTLSQLHFICEKLLHQEQMFEVRLCSAFVSFSVVAIRFLAETRHWV